MQQSNHILLNTYATVNKIHTFICTRKSLRCSLNAGISWFKLKSPVTKSFTWALQVKIQWLNNCFKKKKTYKFKVIKKCIYSCRWGNADLRRLATYSWINIWLFTGFPGFNGVLIFPSSTKLNIYARIDACIVRPVDRKDIINPKLQKQPEHLMFLWL